MNIIADVWEEDALPTSMNKFCVQSLNMSKGQIKNGKWVGLRSEHFCYYMRGNKFFRDARITKYAQTRNRIHKQKWDCISKSKIVHKFYNKE